MSQQEIDALRAQPVPAQALLIGGAWTAATSGATLDVISPIDGRRIGTLPAAQGADVDAAVAAARRAFDSGPWPRMAPAERKRILHRIADRIEAQQLALAVLGVRDNGTEIAMALKAEPGSAATTFRYYAEWADKITGEIAPTPQGTLGLVHQEPVGVVGAIVPWNFPLMIGSWKIAPALAAGNCVVLKPSEEASLSLLALARICLEAGLPEGVLNVVTGTGAQAGDALARHPGVDVLAFTGSGGVGRQLLKASAESNLKRVVLELGGKSPNIVFADAPDLEHAARVCAQGVFRNSGQVCVAGTRLLVQRPIHGSFVRRVAELAAAWRVGDPLDLRTEAGCVINRAQLARNQQALARAVTDGARRVTGGEVIEPVPGGTYMRPAVVDHVAPGMQIAREEVFGPVLAVLPFDDEAGALALANDTPYGLASAVWTRDLERAHRMVRGIRAGVVHVNTYGGTDITVPLAPARGSGHGADKSQHALHHYLQLKTAWMQLT